MARPLSDSQRISPRPIAGRKHSYLIGGLLILAIASISGIVLAALTQWQQSQLRSQATQVDALLSSDPVEGLVTAIQAIGQDHTRLWNAPPPEVEASLLRAVQTAKERNRFGLSEPVKGVAISTDGQTIAASGAGQTIQFWDRQGNPLRTLQAAHPAIRSLSFSPDGQMFVGAYPPATGQGMQLWNIQQNMQYPNAENTILATAFSPDSQTLVSGTQDGRVYLWNRQGEAITTLTPAHLGKVTAVAFTNSTIASSSEDGTIHLWNHKGEFQGQLWTGTGATALRVRRSGEQIIAETANGTQAFVWDGTAGQWNSMTLSPADRPADLSPDNSIIAVNRENYQINLLPLNSQPNSTDLLTLTGHTAAVTAVQFVDNSNTLLSGSEDGSVRLWDVRDSNLIDRHQTPDWNSQTPGSIAFSAAAERIVASTTDGSLRVRDVNGNLIHQLISPNQIQILKVSFSKNGERLAAYKAQSNVQDANNPATGEIQILDTQHNQVLFSIAPPEPLVHLALSPDGRKLATVGQTGVIRLWNEQGELAAQSTSDHLPIAMIAVSPNGQQVVTVEKQDATQQTCLWTLQSDQLTQQSCQSIASQTIAFHPTGQTIALAANQNAVYLWNIQTDQLSEPTPTPQNHITTLAFSPDGNKLVTGGADGTVQLLNAQAQTIGKPFVGHGNGVQSIGFSRDGQTVISLSQTGEIRVWAASWQGWLQTACERLQFHPVLQSPATESARVARSICQNQVWSSASPTAAIQAPSPDPAAVQQETRLVVKLSERRVYVYQGDIVEASYPVAIGKAGWETPTGSFKVIQMEQNPSWTHPLTKEVIPPNAANNPLGDRWIAFWTDGQAAIGFHGTPDADSVGQPASHGCIRMFKEDVHALYDRVKLGTSVSVEP